MVAVNTLAMYLATHNNVLLEGIHGTGKTTMSIDACASLKHEDGTPWTMLYFSASTLDPFTQLVGVPFPVDLPMDGQVIKTLESIRPHAIDEVDVVMFDEFNRAEYRTTNAVMEILQFKAINGEPLKNLKAIIACQNPPGGDYNVVPLDPAVVDRFNFKIQVDAKPNKSYITAALMNTASVVSGEKFDSDRVRKVTDGAFEWYKGLDNNAPYISPRKIHQICRNVLELQDYGAAYHQIQEAVEHAMPPNDDSHVEWPHGQLAALMLGQPGSNPDNSDFDYAGPDVEATWLKTKADPKKVVKWLEGEQDEEKRQHVIDTMLNIKANQIISRNAPIFELLTQKDVERLCNLWGKAKAGIVEGVIKQTDDSVLSEKARENFLKWKIDPTIN